MNKFNQEVPESESYFDILRQIERLTQEVNGLAHNFGRPVFKRYPVTFALLVLFAIVIVSESVKEILKSFGVFESNPWITLVIGLTVLILTGTLYRKLNK